MELSFLISMLTLSNPEGGTPGAAWPATGTPTIKASPSTSAESNFRRRPELLNTFKRVSIVGFMGADIAYGGLVQNTWKAHCREQLLHLEAHRRNNLSGINQE